MKERYKPLLTPWKIGKVEIKNRIVLTSMGGTDLFGWMEWNHFDKDGARFILEVAKNNAGLVLPGCQPVYNPMYGQWLHKNKKMYDDLAKWMPEFHKTGAKLFVQLTAGFGRSFTVSEMMEKLYNNPVLRVLSKPVMDLDKITATASPSPNRWSDKLPSREMTKEEIQEFIDSFAKSSKLLKDAGVDGVEVHAVHEGYLLDQFTLHYVNKRTDEYGGSLENRYRFAAEIVKAIKAACGPDFPVSLRYSVVSKTKGFRQGALPGEEYVEAGRDMAESEIAAKFLQDAGYDMLNCDNGTYDAWYWAHPPVYMPENCNLAEVEHIKKFVDIPVVCAGRMTLEAAANGLEPALRRGPFALRKNLDRFINKSVQSRWIEPIERVRKRQLDGRVGPKRLSGKPKLPSCEHGGWHVVPQAVAAIEQRSRPYLQGIDIADDAEVSPMAVAVGQKGIADNHLRHRPSHGSLVCSMLAEVAAVPVVRRASSLAAKGVLNVNSRNIFLAAV